MFTEILKEHYRKSSVSGTDVFSLRLSDHTPQMLELSLGLQIRGQPLVSSGCQGSSDPGMGKMTRSWLCTVTWELTFYRQVSRSRSGRTLTVSEFLRVPAVWVLPRSVNYGVLNLCTLPKTWTLSQSSDLSYKSHDLLLALSLTPHQYFCGIRVT